MKLPLFLPSMFALIALAPPARAQSPGLRDDDLGTGQVEVDSSGSVSEDGTARTDTTVEVTDDDAVDEAQVAAPDAAGDPVAAVASIADILNGDENFTTLIALLQAAGLEAEMGDALPLTVFAPTNAAFEELGQGMVDNLMEPDKRGDLRKILLHHVISGSFTIGDLEEGQLTTLAGDNLHLLGAGGEVTVDGYPIIRADLVGKDGVVHEIDRVLLPLEIRDPQAALDKAAEGPGSATQSAIDAEDGGGAGGRIESGTAAETPAEGETIETETEPEMPGE